MEKLFKKQMTTLGHIVRAVENFKRIGQAKITRDGVETKAVILDRKWDAFQKLYEQIEEGAPKEDMNPPYVKIDDTYAIIKGPFLDYACAYYSRSFDSTASEN